MTRRTNEAQTSTSSEAEKVLVAVAWPYANGERHIGHASSLVPADVLARFHRSIGNHVLMVGGTDEHGTPNRIAAEERGMDPQEYVDETSALIRRDFIDLGMSFDWFTRTTSPVHKENAQAFFEELADKGYIVKDTMQGSYDALSNEPLADRYIEGSCPFCGALSRGDQCDDCGRMLDPADLVEPTSTRTGNSVVFRETPHYFLDLESLSGKVSDFLSGKVNLRDDARRFSESIVDGLKARSITREMDWGIDLPEKYDLSEEQRVMYVWFEAVIGYVSAAMEWSEENDENGESWKDWWQNDAAKHIYAMGKDNVPFHTLVWPAILEGLNDDSDANWHLPDTIASTGNLNFRDGKFSSSKGNVIYIHDLIDEIGPDSLRFYCIAAGPESKDSSFSYEDLARKVNDELLAKWGNVVSRSVTLIRKYNDGEIPALPEILDDESQQLIDEVKSGFDEVGHLIERVEFSKALRKTMSIITELNKYINAHEPWKEYKTDKDLGNQTMAVVINAVLNLNTMMSPFIPHASQRTYNLLGGHSQFVSQPTLIESKKHGVDILTGEYSNQQIEWGYSSFEDLHTVSDDKAHLFKKIDPEILEAEIRTKFAARSMGALATKAAQHGN